MASRRSIGEVVDSHSMTGDILDANSISEEFVDSGITKRDTKGKEKGDVEVEEVEDTSKSRRGGFVEFWKTFTSKSFRHRHVWVSHLFWSNFEEIFYPLGGSPFWPSRNIDTCG